MKFDKATIIESTENIPGIYIIRNTVNGKCYIGQSIRLRKRLLRHLQRNIDYDNPLYKAFHKYGLEAFEFDILNTLDSADYNKIKGQLDSLEKENIQKYNSYVPKGYNQTLGGDGGILGYKFTEAQKHHVSINSIKATSNRIYCYDIVNNTYYTCISRRTLENIISIKGLNERNFIIHKRYIVARTKEVLESKIKKYKNSGLIIFSKEEDPRNIDIKSGMKCKEWMAKWQMSKSSYCKKKAKIMEERNLLQDKMEKVLDDARWCIEEIKAQKLQHSQEVLNWEDELNKLSVIF